jgi:hypothetical protein
MAKTPRQKANKVRLPPFTPLLNEELVSVAYLALTGSAAKCLMHFKHIHGVCKFKADEDANILFDYTYAEAKKYGFGKSTFSRIIDELVAKGFLNVITQGGLRGRGMSNTKFQMSERWRDYGKPSFMKRQRYPSEP